jgi:magnesium transporter
MKNPLDHRAQPREQADRTPGAAPGLLVAPAGSPPPRLDVLVSGNGKWTLHREVALADVKGFKEGCSESEWIWVDVNGLGNAGLIADIGELFGLHRLGLEDAMNLHQRPKTEAYDDVQYTVLQVPYIQGDELEFEQVSIFLGQGFLVTFQANPESKLSGIYQRFEQGAGRLTNSRVDYLFYAVMDALVDHSFPVLEYFDEREEDLEEQVFSSRSRDVIEDIHDVRKEIMVLRRVLWNQSLVPDYLIKMQQGWLADDTKPYLRDVQDHAHRALGLVEQLREASTGLFDLQNSMNSAQLNEVMKVLTIISTVFIPLTFIVGVYGMNFNPEVSRLNMPELNWKFGYVYAWCLMTLSGTGMVWMFRKKGWIGSQAGKRRKRRNLLSLRRRR